MVLPLLGLLAMALASPASAQRVYHYTDKDGVTVITNVPAGGKKAKPKRDSAQPASLEFRPSKSVPEFDSYIEEACSLYKIPPALARAVMAVESNYNPSAVSEKGAQGLMQLMPETASEMFVTDSFDPRQNIHGGVRYLRVLANQFGGDMVQIVAAYNAGPDAVKRAGGIPNIAETQEYVKRVLRLYFAFKSEI